VLVAALAAPAHSGEVLALTDGHVAQFREALSAIQDVLRDARVLDVNDADAEAQLKQAQPPVILAIGERALRLAEAAAPATPTVFCLVPAAQAKRTRTITGVPVEPSPYAELAQLKQVDDKGHRIGVIYAWGSRAYVDEAEAAAGALELTLVRKEVADPREVRSALVALGDVDALWLPPDPHLYSPEMFAFLLDFTVVQRRIALFGFQDEHTRAGALASVAVDFHDAGRRAARLALGIAARAPAKRLPVPEAKGSPGVLTVNKKTARRLGLEIPDVILRERAHQVYE
jgi:putative ABC transport system substrate-binding protein